MKTSIWLKGAILLSFIFMLTMNGLANALPLNGITTGEISDLYPNLFAPAGITFSIWGIIYLLLTIYVIFELGLLGSKPSNHVYLRHMIGKLFALSSLINGLWILAWHYQWIKATMVLMLLLLGLLIAIEKMLVPAKLTSQEYWCIKVPFDIYLGWITIATIANVTILAVSMNFSGLGISESVWTALVISIGLLIATLTSYRIKSIAFNVVVIWAYLGILIKHVSKQSFNGQYPLIIYTAIFAIAFLSIVSIKLFLKRLKSAV